MITNRNVKVLTVFAALLVGFSSFADEVSNTYTTTYVVHTNESSFEFPVISKQTVIENPSIKGCERNCDFAIRAKEHALIATKNQHGNISNVRFKTTMDDLIAKDLPAMKLNPTDCVDCMQLAVGRHEK